MLLESLLAICRFKGSTAAAILVARLQIQSSRHHFAVRLEIQMEKKQ